MDKIKTKINHFLSLKPKYSNYFGIDLEGVETVETENTLVLLKPYDGFRCVYFLSNNAAELTKMLKSLPQTDIINIPAKKELDETLLNVLNKSGYTLFEVYERMYNNQIEQKNKVVESFAVMEDIPTIYESLYSFFVPFTDTLPTGSELADMVLGKQIQVERDAKNKVVAAYALETNKNKSYLRFVYSTVKGQGLILMNKCFDYLASIGVNYLELWVRCGNVAASKLYDRLGFVHSGLKDYTFTKGLPNKYKKYETTDY